MYVIVIVSCKDMEGNERLKVIGPFNSVEEAEKAKPGFLRATLRQVVMELTPPTPNEK